MNFFDFRGTKSIISLLAVQRIVYDYGALAGADIATVPYKVIEQMTHHPLTDAGIEKFKKDYIAVFGE